MLAAGGDCAVDVAIIGYLNHIHPGLRVIWIDAHLDANTPETSPNGNFHGMPVSAILGRAPEPMRPFLGTSVDPALFRYVGIRIGDDGDYALQRELNLQQLDPQAPIEGPVHSLRSGCTRPERISLRCVSGWRPQGRRCNRPGWKHRAPGRRGRLHGDRIRTLQ